MQSDYLIRAMMSKLATDSKFVGVFMMITGALICLSIVGLPLGIPYIFAGMRAKEGGSQIEQYVLSNNNSIKTSAYENYQKHFFILKVLYIVGFIGAILGLIFIFFILYAFVRGLGPAGVR
ncbi:MAG: hypothetical protein IPJ75_11870 [Ignavibacteriales bacterium]|nr:hypothetical protein [Ignavibacteriales bacterium]